MVLKEQIHQRFGSMVRTVTNSEQVSEADVLEELAMYMMDFDCTVHAEHSEDNFGYVLIVSVSLDEDIVYHIVY